MVTPQHTPSLTHWVDMNVDTCTVHDVICDFGFLGTILYPSYFSTRSPHGYPTTCPCRNLRKNVSKTCARNCARKQQKMRRKVRKDTEFAELFAENCGSGPNHETCCILRIVICTVQSSLSNPALYKPAPLINQHNFQ